MAATRVFGGKRFWYYKRFKTKREAQRVAIKVREAGSSARVVRVLNPYLRRGGVGYEVFTQKIIIPQ